MTPVTVAQRGEIQRESAKGEGKKTRVEGLRSDICEDGWGRLDGDGWACAPDPAAATAEGSTGS